MWFLGKWTHVFILVQKALYPLSQLPSSSYYILDTQWEETFWISDKYIWMVSCKVCFKKWFIKAEDRAVDITIHISLINQSCRTRDCYYNNFKYNIFFFNCMTEASYTYFITLPDKTKLIYCSNSFLLVWRYSVDFKAFSVYSLLNIISIFEIFCHCLLLWLLSVKIIINKDMENRKAFGYQESRGGNF